MHLHSENLAGKNREDIQKYSAQSDRENDTQEQQEWMRELRGYDTERNPRHASYLQGRISRNIKGILTSKGRPASPEVVEEALRKGLKGIRMPRVHKSQS